MSDQKKNIGDEKFEVFLQREAQAYNVPPATVPRDELYAAITAQRRLSDVRQKTPDRRHGARYAWIGMAATLVIGVAIGKFALSRQDAAAPSLAVAPSAPTAPQNHTDTTSYARAATEELSRAEALLTAYSASNSNVAVDKQLSSWARDILSNTRLLLDSPAAADPARRKLLQDLELVLVQMVQRSPDAGAGEERAHIDRSLERTQVLTRLRSTVPAVHNN
jgi:hypothetical protein